MIGCMYFSKYLVMPTSLGQPSWMITGPPSSPTQLKEKTVKVLICLIVFLNNVKQKKK